VAKRVLPMRMPLRAMSVCAAGRSGREMGTTGLRPRLSEFTATRRRQSFRLTAPPDRCEQTITVRVVDT
jgi:hypothetical protein